MSARPSTFILDKGAHHWRNRHVRKSGTYVLVAEGLQNSVQFNKLGSQLGWNNDGRLLHDFEDTVCLK